MVNPFENAVHPGEQRSFTPDDRSLSHSASIQHEALALWQQAALSGRRERLSEPTHIDTGNHAELFGSRADKSVSAETNRDKLMESAARHFKNDPEKLLAFKHDMSAFEDRMGKAGAVDVQKTYAEVQRLLDSPSKIVKEAERVSIASDIIHRAAFSTQSNQGMSNDCVAASLENRLYSRSPAEAAKLVTDTVLTGRFTDTAGRVVTVSHATIANSDGELTADAKKLGLEPRSQGDRIMQAIIRNEEYAAMNSVDGVNAANNGLKYEIGKPTKDNPTGEFVRDYSERPPVDVSISHMGMQADSNAVYSGLSSKTNERDFEFSDPESTGPNVAAFKHKLESMQGQYPLVVVVNPNEEPFASAPGTRGLSDLNHAITVEGYDPNTGMVRYRNSNFGSREQTISADKLFDGMRANLDDSVVAAVAKVFKEHKAEIDQHPERMGTVLYNILNQAEVAQRLQLLKRLEIVAGMKLEHYLSREQERELGIAPTFFESIFGR
ncbi:MAG: hypothetical protein P4L53_04250 [Candidatus Obscuribacterales bacterium]|nr:hypothetical protein [Candidatus Obscuribacterales bacterium]